MPQLQIKFARVDPAAKADITSTTAPDKKPWAVLDDLRLDNIPPPGSYATLEHNYTILDGAMEEFPDTPNIPPRTWGLWSDSLSDENGIFANPPTLDIAFANNHKSLGLTLYFYPHTDDYAKTVRATWYNTANDVIKSGVYTLDSNTGVIREPVTDFRRIKLEMLSTNIRHRYIKLFALEYGIVRILPDAEIDACRILEEVDPTVESISINTLSARIRTRESFFSPVTGEDADEMMMKRQILTVTSDNIPFGTFFLEEWKDVNQSGIVFDFTAGDAVSVLDLYTFKGGMYTNALASDIIAAIFNVAFPTGLVKPILDPAFTASRVSGWIPICSCGAALQHVCFAIHAVADDSRIGNVWIYPRDTEVTFHIPKEKQYRRGSDKPTEYFSGVDVVSHSYVAGDETATPQKGDLPAGRHEIRFREPLHTLSVTGGSLVESHVNYAVVNVTAAGTVVLTGRRYTDNRLTHSARVEITAGEVENVKRYDGYTMVSPAQGLALAQKIFSFLQYRIRTEGDVELGDLEVGYMAELETRGRNIAGTIVSLDSNLRANKTTIEVIGNVVD